jgi:ribonucleotide monophosphatase NagD (HAD superfamily)
VAGAKAHVVGKPSRSFFEAVIRDVDAHGCAAGDRAMPPVAGTRIAIIGDDVEADLGDGA